MKKFIWLSLALGTVLVACPFQLNVPTIPNDYLGASGNTLIADLNARRASPTVATPVNCTASLSNPSQFPARIYTSSVAAFTRDSRLDTAAHSHADFLAKKYPNFVPAGVDPHNGAGDGAINQRTVAAGFSNQVVGEILAYGFSSNSSVINAWMTSTNGHCQNIMDLDFNRVGVAKINFGASNTYWVVVFGKI